MGTLETKLMIAVGELILKHGVPATLQIIKDWDVENPSVKDIEALADRVPSPESYFEE